jgi:hypothetical protein
MSPERAGREMASPHGVDSSALDLEESGFASAVRVLEALPARDGILFERALG